MERQWGRGRLVGPVLYNTVGSEHDLVMMDRLLEKLAGLVYIIYLLVPYLRQQNSSHTHGGSRSDKHLVRHFRSVTKSIAAFPVPGCPMQTHSRHVTVCSAVGAILLRGSTPNPKPHWFHSRKGFLCPDRGACSRRLEVHRGTVQRNVREASQRNASAMCCKL